MPPRKSNGATELSVKAKDGLWLSREEFDALMALKESSADQVVKDAQMANRNHDLLVTCSAQARRLAEVDLAVQHLEQINGLQRVFIDLLRADYPAVASLEDLSAFWRTWFITTEGLATRDPKQRDEIGKLEPDLFRSWRIWVRDAGRASRTFSMAGTRAEVDGDRLALSQAALQDRLVEQQRAQIALLAARARELEAEVEAYRNASKAQGKS